MAASYAKYVHFCHPESTLYSVIQVLYRANNMQKLIPSSCLFSDCFASDYSTLFTET